MKQLPAFTIRSWIDDLSKAIERLDQAASSEADPLELRFSSIDLRGIRETLMKTAIVDVAVETREAA
jgi:hypothetical protein